MTRRRATTPTRRGRAAAVPRNRRLAPPGTSRSRPAKEKPAPRARATSGGGRGATLRLLKRLGRPVAILLLGAAVVAGGVLAHRFVVQSPHFHVARVEVSPTVHVSAAEVRKLAAIGPRTNIFTVNLERVAARVERHPWIARAKAVRRMPDAIRIEVKEHTAVAAVLVHGARDVETRFYLVTADGRPFKRAAHAELEGLVLITGIDRTEYLQRRRGATERIRAAIAGYRRYAALPGRPRVGELHVDPVEGITLYTDQRAVQVRFGIGNIAAKLRRFDQVVAALTRRGQRAAIIRLDNERHPAQVTVRLAEAQVESPGPR